MSFKRQNFMSVPRKVTVIGPLTAENIPNLGAVHHCSYAATADGGHIAYAHTTAGKVQVPEGHFVVLENDEAYPISEQELNARYEPVGKKPAKKAPAKKAPAKK